MIQSGLRCEMPPLSLKLAAFISILDLLRQQTRTFRRRTLKT